MSDNEARSRRVAIGLAVLLGVLVFIYRFASSSGFSNDHFVHLARAQQMVLGGWPVRDFVDPGLPLMYLTSAFGQLLGHSLLTEAVIVFGAIGAAAGVTLWLTWRAGVPLIAGVPVVILQAFVLPRTYSYPKLILYVVAIWLCWRVLERPVVARACALGAFIAVAFLFRHDHGLLIGLAAMVAIGAASLVGWRARGRLAAACLGTVVVLLLPWAVYVQTSQGLGAYVRSAVAFSRIEAAQTSIGSPWRGFSRSPTDPAVAAMADAPIVQVSWQPGLAAGEIVEHERAIGLERVEHQAGLTWSYRLDPARVSHLLEDTAVATTSGLDHLTPSWWRRLGHIVRRPLVGSRLATRENAEAFLFDLFLVMPLVFIVWAAGGWGPVRRVPGGSASVVVVAVLALAVDAVFLRDPLDARLADVAAPQAILGAWALAWGVGARRAAKPVVRVAVPVLTIGVFVLTAAAVVTVGDTAEQFNRMQPGHLQGPLHPLRRVTSGLREEFNTRTMPSQTSRSLVPVFKYLQACTAPRDRFMYVGFGPEMYFYARRGFAGGQALFLGQYYSSETEQQLTRERLRAERVPVIILPESFRDEFRTTFGIVAAYIESHYEPFGQIAVTEDQQLTLLAHRGWHPTGTYEPYGWRCSR